MRRMFLIAIASAAAMAQTQIDLATQAKRIDFTSASSTKPAKAGTTLPATCAVGEMFFKSNAPAGSNLYACTAANLWSVQGSGASLSVESGGSLVGTRGAINFSTGSGLITAITDTGSEISMVSAVDTAVLQTQPGEQTGAALLCLSGGNAHTTYQCSLSPTAALYTKGMVLHWIPDVAGAGGATTLNVDTLGAVPVKGPDGTSDPGASDIVASRMYSIWYDGTSFRLPAVPSGTGGVADPGSNGIVYRNGLGTAAAATSDNLSGPHYCQDTGSGGIYTCNLSPPILAYTPGAVHWFRANSANTGPATINLNSLGPKAITKLSAQDLSANDIVAGQWVMLIYDGVSMQMQSQTAASGGAGSVASVFGRTGVVGSQGGDYTTAQIAENGNLYFTNNRALAAVTWDTLNGKPTVFSPAAHAVSHKNGGSDEIAAAAPAASAIPKADAGGKLAAGWIPVLNQDTTGKAAHADALAMTPSKCSAGNYPLGIDASGNAQNCTAAALTVSSGTAALGTSALASAKCYGDASQPAVVSVAATGVLTTDVVQASFNGDPHGVTGYLPATTGMLTIISYPTADHVNFMVCNNTSASITPGAITLNWRVAR